MTEGISFDLPEKTYAPTYDASKKYPYLPGSLAQGGECEDLALDDDIENYTIKLKATPKEWLSWGSYNCRFYYYQNACSKDGSQPHEMAEQFGPMPFGWNGLVKPHVVSAWLEN